MGTYFTCIWRRSAFNVDVVNADVCILCDVDHRGYKCRCNTKAEATCSTELYHLHFAWLLPSLSKNHATSSYGTLEWAYLQSAVEIYMVCCIKICILRDLKLGRKKTFRLFWIRQICPNTIFWLSVSIVVDKKRHDRRYVRTLDRKKSLKLKK